jgi:hypothetical protein
MSLSCGRWLSALSLRFLPQLLKFSREAPRPERQRVLLCLDTSGGTMRGTLLDVTRAPMTGRTMKPHRHLRVGHRATLIGMSMPRTGGIVMKFLHHRLIGGLQARCVPSSSPARSRTPLTTCWPRSAERVQLGESLPYGRRSDLRSFRLDSLGSGHAAQWDGRRRGMLSNRRRNSHGCVNQNMSSRSLKCVRWRGLGLLRLQ